MTDDLQRLLDEESPEPVPAEGPILAAFLVDPKGTGKRRREGRVLQVGALYLAQVRGREYPASSLDEAVAGAWRMIDGKDPLPQLVPVPVRRGGAA